MHTQRLQTVEEIGTFLSGASAFDFEPQSREEAYQWVRDSLQQLCYLSLGKANNGAVKEYLRKVTGLSRAQITRLIRQYRDTGQLYSQFGVCRMVERCAAQVPALVGRGVTPHVLRHTAACHLLQSGADINTIRAWLGHVSLDTPM